MPIDLCTTAQVRGYLGILSGLQNASDTSLVSTTVPLAIPSGFQTVTPVSISFIQPGSVLGINVGLADEEWIQAVSASTSGGTFTATFSNSHNAGATVADMTDVVIQRLITSISTYWLWYTGKVNSDGSIPSSSTLSSQVNFNEWYDGNGNARLFLRNSPITAVSVVTVNGLAIPQSTAITVPGWVIDQNGRSLVMRSLGSYTNGYYAYAPYYNQRFGPGYLWGNGIQNINIQYTAGYVATPMDVQDAAIRMVGLVFRRKGWIGIKSNSSPQTIGTINYDMTLWPLDVIATLDNYKRMAVV